MKPDQFTRQAQSRGLSYRGVSIYTVNTLAEIAETPMPFTKGNGRNKATNARPRAMSPLIAYGLARLNHDQGFYEATEKGREYISKLRAEGLLA